VAQNSLMCTMNNDSSQCNQQLSAISNYHQFHNPSSLADAPLNQLKTGLPTLPNQK